MSYSPNRPPKELSLDRSKAAWDLRIKGWSQERIAEALGVSQSAVSKMLFKATQKFAEAYLIDIKTIKDQQVAQLEFIAHEAIIAWEDSRAISGGESKFLQIFLQAKEHIRKIIGIHSPALNKSLNLDIDVTQLTDEQLNDIITGKAFQ